MFSFQKLNNYYEKGMLKEHLDAKQYVEKFFCPLTNGEHALIQEDNVTIVPKDTMKDVYLERFPEDIKKWYKKSTVPKKLICDVKQPQSAKTSSIQHQDYYRKPNSTIPLVKTLEKA